MNSFETTAESDNEDIQLDRLKYALNLIAIWRKVYRYKIAL
jgi:hypothetical protein